MAEYLFYPQSSARPETTSESHIYETWMRSHSQSSPKLRHELATARAASPTKGVILIELFITKGVSSKSVLPQGIVRKLESLPTQGDGSYGMESSTAGADGRKQDEIAAVAIEKVETANGGIEQALQERGPGRAWAVETGVRGSSRGDGLGRAGRV